MVFNIRTFKNIPVWFRRFVKDPWGSFSRSFVEKACRFMEENNIIYVDWIEFDDNIYMAKSAVGETNKQTSCCDMIVRRYIRKDSERRYR